MFLAKLENLRFWLMRILADTLGPIRQAQQVDASSTHSVL
jgi:hypothetical protein